ncbi:RagB/SusD family nutrient uptake outer membrane protein [Pedobacter sp. R-06]|uniref:RagB/SusD family nutrient uptake outer membrane protein n=1 Tax=Pedobacter sp. R-06 TaxID=3404051 RepID=UPI003CEF9B10
MKKINFIIALISIGVLFSCNKLELSPPNIIQDDIALGTEDGVKAYMAALYSNLPIEDFKYSADNQGTNGFNTWNIISTLSINTGENANRNNGAFINPARGYFAEAYKEIRNINYLLAELPKQGLSAESVTRWKAEAYFLRAYTYFAIVKRYGGVPILKEAQTEYIGVDPGKLLVARSSEQQSYDFIASDLDLAIAGLNTTSENKGRANRFIAAGFKSRVMLTAGSIARYGTPYMVDNVMLNGIPANMANSYFAASWQAAKLLEGQYSLYRKKWSATDKLSTADNYADLFLDAASPENIFVKGYSFPEAVHSWDALMSPQHMTSTYGDRFCPTLDYVELFDGLPKNAKGQLNTLNPDGTYKVYNNVRELFDNVEPRLRGTVLLPGQPFKGLNHDIRRGTFIESVDPSVPLQKFFPDDSKTAYTTLAYYSANIKQSSDNRPAVQVPIVLASGEKILPTGLDGILSTPAWATVTGFSGRKYLNPTMMVSQTALHMSIQSWIEMRYAEILLNRAEAALELVQNGGTVSGVDLQIDAYNCINDIRSRAGAVLLGSAGELSSAAALPLTSGGYVLAPNRGLQLIRIERRKELAFENKIYWDMIRWRTFDQEVNTRTWRRLNPFLFAKGAVNQAADYVLGKYIFDCRFDERNSVFTFPVRNYYEPIPASEVAKGLKPNLSN